MTKSLKAQVKEDLPNDHRPYTDKYFLRTNQIFKKAGINPRVSMMVFARGEGKIAGLEKAAEVLKKFSDLEKQQGEVWVTKDEHFSDKQHIMIIKGPVQSL